MLRTKLKDKANRSGREEDYMKHKQQRNIVVQMNRKAKYKFYQSIGRNSIETDKQFWKALKSTFSIGNPMGEKNILVERDEIIKDEDLLNA